MQTKDDLRKLFQEGLSRLFDKTLPPGAARKYRFMHTSGTTGLPLPVLYTDRPDWVPEFMGEGQRILMVFGSKPLRVDFARSHVDDDTGPGDIMCINIKNPPEVLERIRTDYRPTSFVCPPSVLLRLTHTWPRESCEAIISITLTGELATEMITKEIATRFPNASINNYYPSIEVSLMGEQSKGCAWNEFHPVKGVKFDITDEDENGTGYLLISKENKGGLNLKQYRIGDLAQKVEDKDGRSTIRLYGRQGFDYIKLAGALLVREEFDRVTRELEKYIDDFKAEVRTHIHDGSPIHELTLYITAPQKNTLNDKDLAELIAKEFTDRLFVTPNSTLKHAIENKIFTPLVVNVVTEVTHATTKPQRLKFIE